MSLYVNNGTWRQPKSMSVNQDGTWVVVKKLWVNQDGTWKQVAPLPGSFTATTPGVTHSLVVPHMVREIYLTGIGGGGGAGNIVDGGRNDDFGACGSGGSGQRIYNYPIAVQPLETISIVVGAGGLNASAGRDHPNQGGTGGTSYVSCSSGTYYLYGGAGGYGGVGDAGNQYNGGTTSLTNATIIGVAASNGTSWTPNRSRGGKGFVNAYGALGSGQAGQQYGGGGPYRYELDATEYGGGGAGAYYNYIREDNGNSPGWGGKGKSGLMTVAW